MTRSVPKTKTHNPVSLSADVVARHVRRSPFCVASYVLGPCFVSCSNVVLLVAPHHTRTPPRRICFNFRLWSGMCGSFRHRHPNGICDDAPLNRFVAHRPNRPHHSSEITVAEGQSVVFLALLHIVFRLEGQLQILPHTHTHTHTAKDDDDDDSEHRRKRVV